MSTTPVIDYRIRVPRNIDEFPEYMNRYQDLLQLQDKQDYEITDVIDMMDANGVDMAVLHAEFSIFRDYVHLNNLVHEAVEEYPDRFIGFGSVDPRDGVAALEELDRCLSDLSMAGINLQPFVFELPPTHRLYYPIYAKCLEYDVPVGLHTGINYSTLSFEVGRPIYHEQILSDFPDLSIIAHHTGWPWVTESAAIARKHPSYYLELGGLSPQYLTPENGWAPLLSYANSVLKDQVLFASDYHAMDQGRVLEELVELPLNDEALRNILGANTANLLDI